MCRSLAALFVFPFVTNAQEPPPIAPTEAKTPAEKVKLFKLPPGFECQLVASEPDVQKPMQCAFDTKVVSSSNNCEQVLQAAGMLVLFEVRVDGLVASQLQIPGKPAPDTFLKAA